MRGVPSDSRPGSRSPPRCRGGVRSRYRPGGGRPLLRCCRWPTEPVPRHRPRRPRPAPPEPSVRAASPARGRSSRRPTSSARRTPSAWWTTSVRTRRSTLRLLASVKTRPPPTSRPAPRLRVALDARRERHPAGEGEALGAVDGRAHSADGRLGGHEVAARAGSRRGYRPQVTARGALAGEPASVAVVRSDPTLQRRTLSCSPGAVQPRLCETPSMRFSMNPLRWSPPPLRCCSSS